MVRRLILLSFCIIAYAVGASALTSTVNGTKFYFVKNSDGTSVTITNSKASVNTTSSTGAKAGYNTYSGDVTIPETITYSGTTYTVTAIGPYAFQGCTGLTSVTFPSTVTSTGIYAFGKYSSSYLCSSLTSVDMSECTELSLGNYTFQYCQALTDVKFADYCDLTLGTSVFVSNAFTSIELPDGISFSGIHFYSCSSLTTIKCKSTSVATSTATSNTFFYTTNVSKIYVRPYLLSEYQDCTSQPWSSFDDSVYYPYYDLDVPDGGAATLALPFTATVPDGVTLYSLDEIGLDSSGSLAVKGTALNYSSGSSLPYNTPVYVVAEAGRYEFLGEYYGGADGYYLAGVSTTPTSGVLTGVYQDTTLSGYTYTLGDDGAFALSTSADAFSGYITSEQDLSAFGTTITFTTDDVTEAKVNDGEYIVNGVTWYFIVNSANNTAIITNAYGDYSSITIDDARKLDECLNTYSGALTVPDKVKDSTGTYTVTAIGSYAFLGCTGLTSLTVPSTVTSIGAYAFAYGASTSAYTTLTTIDLSEATELATIGNYAFQYCKNLTDVVMPDSHSATLTIGTGAFYGCSSLTSIDIPEGTAYIGAAAFSNCSALTTIKNKATAVPAIYAGTETTSAFNGASNIAKVYVRPYLVTDYRSYATTGSFALWDALDDSVFYPYYDLEVPSTGAATLALPFTATVPDGVTLYSLDVVGYDASDVLSVQGTALSSDTLSYTNPVYVKADAGTYEFLGYYGSSDSNYYLADETATSTGGVLTGVYQDTSLSGYTYALDDAGTFTSASSASAFSGYIESGFDLSSYGLSIAFTTSSVDEIMEGKCIVDNVTWYFIVNEDGTTATITSAYGDASSLSVANARTEESCLNTYSGALTMPETVTDATGTYTVTAIGAYAFLGCYELTSLTVPSTLTEIGTYAFSYGTSNSVYTTLKTIDLSAATGLTSIGNYAFYYCQDLTDIIFPELEGELTLGNGTFSRCTSIEEIVLPEGITSLALQALNYCTSLQSATLPSTLTTIYSSAFYNCTSLATVKCKATTVPDVDTSATSSSSVFYGCSALTTVYVRPYLIADYQDFETTGKYTIWEALDDSVFYPYYDLVVPENGVTTLALPFTAAVPSGVTLYSLDYLGYDSDNNLGVVGTDITSTLGGTIDYNTPVYVAAEAGTYEFLGKYNSSDSNYYLADETATATYGVLTGVYQDTDLTGYTYTLNDDGVFALSTTADAFGGYILSEDDLSEYGTTIAFTTEEITSFVENAGLQATYTDGNNIKWYFTVNNDGTTATITNSAYDDSKVALSDATKNTYSGALTVPDSVCVDNADDPVYYTVTKIGAYAFYGCTSLDTISVPASLVSTGLYSFAGSTLPYIALSDVTTSVGSNSFNGCTSLTSIALSPILKTIGDRAFFGCTALTSIELPELLTGIGEGAFYGCTALTTVKVTSETVPAVVSSDAEEYNVFDATALANVYVHPYLLADYLSYMSTTSYKLWDGLEATVFYPYYDLEVSATGVATIALPYTAVVPDGVTIYTLTAIGIDENHVLAVAGTDITSNNDGALPYDTPVYLTADEGTYEFFGKYSGGDDAYHLSDVTTSATDELLTGVYQTTKIDGYVFTLDDSGVFASATSVDAYNAYLTSEEDLSEYGETIAFTANGVSSFDESIYAGKKCTYTADDGTLFYFYVNDDCVTASLCNSAYDDESVDVTKYYSKTDKGNDTYSGTIVIPDSVSDGYNWYPITDIAAYTFYGCQDLDSVTAPASIKTIGSYAFSSYLGSYYCMMTYFDISGATGLESIGDGAFQNNICTTSNFKLPEYVTGSLTLGEEAFRGNSLKTSLTLPAVAGDVTIEKNCFYTCGNLATLDFAGEIGGSLTIEAYGFDAQTGIQSFVVPSAKSISLGYFAFRGCTALTSIELNADSVALGSGSFYNCSALTTIKCGSKVVPDRVTELSYNVFYGATAVTKVYVYPYLIEEYQDFETSGRYKIWESLDDDVFYPYYNAKVSEAGGATVALPFQATVPNGVTLYEIDKLGTDDARSAGLVTGDALTTTTLDSNTPVYMAADKGFYSFLGIYGGDNAVVEDIDSTPVVGLLTGTYKDIASDTLSLDDDTYAYVFDVETATFGLAEDASEIDEFTAYILTDKDLSDFDNTLAFTTETVKNIDLRTYDYNGVTFYFIVNDDGETATITNATGDTSDYDLADATYGTYSGDIEVPETVSDDSGTYTVTGIGAYSFLGCELGTVTLPSTVTEIGNYAFSYYYSTTSSTSSSSSTTVNSTLTSIDLSEATGLKTIGEYAFRRNEVLETISLPTVAGELSIDAYSFYYCKALTSIVLPENTVSIGQRAFLGASSLTTVSLPSTLTSLGEGCFSSCTSLTTVKCAATTVPGTDANSTTSSLMSSAAFASASSLSYVYVRPYLLADYQSYTTDASYKVWDGLSDKLFYPYYDLEVGEAGVATLALPFESIVPEGVTLYSLDVVGVDSNDALAVQGTSLDYSAGDALAYDKPVYVEAEEGTYEFLGVYYGGATGYYLSDIATTPIEGVLSGVYQDTAADDITVDAGMAPFVLDAESGVFVVLTDDATVGEFSAYIVADEGWTEVGTTITFTTDTVTTGISSTSTSSQTVDDGAVYTLQGVKVNPDNLQRGIYIQNGRKFVVK